MTCQVGVRYRITAGRAVAFSIRDVFENRRNRMLIRILRQPQASGESHAIRHRDPNVLYFPDFPRKFFDDVHAASS